MLDVTNTYRDLERSGVDTALLPVGAIERHGWHLPLSADWAQADAVARGVAQQLSAFLLSGMPYGNSRARAGLRGSVSLSPETLGAGARDRFEPAGAGLPAHRRPQLSCRRSGLEDRGTPAFTPWETTRRSTTAP
jgi:hypothetical protein